MPKNIILCSDGTGNIANKNRGTNVFKLFEALDTSGHLDNDAGDVRQQMAFYDDGVGTERGRWLRLATGAVGWGLSRNVRQLYRHLCRCYEPGDSIYLFGFSRGAFTVRTLAGLIVDCGVIDVRRPEAAKGFWPFRVLPLAPGGRLWLRWLSWRALRTHRRHYVALLQRLWNGIFRLAHGEEAVAAFRQRYSTERHGEPVRIHFIGVWDTVNSVGVPSEELRRIIGTLLYRYTFPVTTLSPRVEKACHALSLDDERQSFTPVLWNESLRPQLQECACGGDRSEGAGGPRIEQVWFPGMHADVGGGYAKDGLSHVPLHWMMGKAAAHGLRFNPTAATLLAERRDGLDTMHDSRGGVAHYYAYRPRDIGVLCERAEATCRIHASAFARLLARTDDYVPVPLPAGYRVLATDGERLDPRCEKIGAAAATSCMRSRRFSLWTRRLAHRGLLALTVLLVGLAVVGGLSFDDVTGMDVAAIVEALDASRSVVPLGLPIALALGLAVWIASTVAKARILGERRRYWWRAVRESRAAGDESAGGGGQRRTAPRAAAGGSA